MPTPDRDEPAQDTVARFYMTHKGLGDLEPVDVVRLRDETAWMYTYKLPDGGELDLVVEWSPTGGWSITVDDFRITVDNFRMG